MPIELDLLVPERQAPTAGRRSAEMPPHHKMAARRVPGLEVASVDRSLMLVPSLEPRETRCVPVHVAGPVALFVAKAFKIRDRLTQGGDRDRLTDKDAGDVLRLMTAVPVTEAVASFSELREEPDVGDIADEGAGLLGSLFGGRRTPGVDMAVRALAGDMPEQRVRALAPAYVAGLKQSRSPAL
ncbi:hypothetical protein [Streptomyces sodiiphilus]|uniref:hypothetical protein n=1 Tax=Streptomyces sodiiphilus TaxID=226217 RepID=UPI0031D3747A